METRKPGRFSGVHGYQYSGRWVKMEEFEAENKIKKHR